MGVKQQTPAEEKMHRKGACREEDQVQLRKKKTRNRHRADMDNSQSFLKIGVDRQRKLYYCTNTIIQLNGAIDS